MSYRAAIRYHATIDVLLEEVHHIGLEEMESMRTEMGSIAECSFGDTDLEALPARLGMDPLAIASSAARRGCA